MLIRSFVLITAGLITAPASLAQTAAAPQLELIVTSAGQPAAPWTQETVCLGKTGKCMSAIDNLQTGETAKIGDRITSGFAATGNGQEIRRAEPAQTKLNRLRAAAQATPPPPKPSGG